MFYRQTGFYLYTAFTYAIYHILAHYIDYFVHHLTEIVFLPHHNPKREYSLHYYEKNFIISIPPNFKKLMDTSNI